MEAKNLETLLDKSNIFLNDNIDEKAPAVLKEGINNENKIEFINNIRNNYPKIYMEN